MLVKYVRENGNPVGAIVAVGTAQIGISKCNSKDRWNRDLAKKIALGRIGSSKKDVSKLPQNYQDIFETEIEEMVRRSVRYFKGSQV